MSLNQAWTSWPAAEFVAHVRRLIGLPGSALARQLGVDWSPHEENTARLYEVLAYWLELEWVDRTTDPEDPEVRRRRAEDKRNRIKPPPHPLIPPVAIRPDELAMKRQQAYLDQVTRSTAPVRESLRVSSDEFDRLLGLT